VSIPFVEVSHGVDVDIAFLLEGLLVIGWKPVTMSVVEIVAGTMLGGHLDRLTDRMWTVHDRHFGFEVLGVD
jgi:hypothetical protein